MNNDDKSGENIASNRDIVFNYIKNYPGSHLRKISKELSLGMGDTQHHLKFLENKGVVRSRRMRMYKVYYDVSIIEGRQESILAVLRQETSRAILLYLVETPGATQGDLAKHLGLSSPTVNWHMSRLSEIGLINYRKDGRFVKYFIEGDVKEIARLIRLFYPALWERLSARLVDLFLDLAVTSGIQEEKKGD